MEDHKQGLLSAPRKLEGGKNYENELCGKAVLEGFFMRLGTEWESFAAVPNEFIEGGDTVVVLGRYTGTYEICQLEAGK